MSMLNVYLFIELLKAADPSAVIAEVKKLELPNCTVKNAVQLADDKLVAHVDFKTGPDATRAVLEKFTTVNGIVQTNIIAVVKPRESEGAKAANLIDASIVMSGCLHETSSRRGSGPTRSLHKRSSGREAQRSPASPSAGSTRVEDITTMSWITASAGMTEFTDSIVQPTSSPYRLEVLRTLGAKISGAIIKYHVLKSELIRKRHLGYHLLHL